MQEFCGGEWIAHSFDGTKTECEHRLKTRNICDILTTEMNVKRAICIQTEKIGGKADMMLIEKDDDMEKTALNGPSEILDTQFTEKWREKKLKIRFGNGEKTPLSRKDLLKEVIAENKFRFREFNFAIFFLIPSIVFLILSIAVSLFFLIPSFVFAIFFLILFCTTVAYAKRQKENLKKANLENIRVKIINCNNKLVGRKDYGESVEIVYQIFTDNTDYQIEKEVFEKISAGERFYLVYLEDFETNLAFPLKDWFLDEKR